MKSRYPPFAQAGLSNERLTFMLNMMIMPNGELGIYGTLSVYDMASDLISNNYVTKNVCSTQHLTFLSRNSPCVLEGGKIYLHGAFPEFNFKPHVFRTEHLLSWVSGFPQVEPSMRALNEELKTLDHWLMASNHESGTIQ